jgi:hypothetical protein
MKIFLVLVLSFFSLYGVKLSKKGPVVIDNTNNLMWQDTKDNTIMLGSQEKANEYCELLDLRGFTNWRLPDNDEVLLIVDKTRDDEMMINKAFGYVLQEGYWTSDRTWRSFGRYGYYLLIKSGSLYYENRNYAKFFRCVRDIE